MKTPKFWKNKNLISCSLYPLGALYGFATKLRLALNHSQKINKPVICIGNLTAGGTGKTPVSISIAKILQKKGKKPFFISRGYGGLLSGVVVDKTKHSPKEVGDEPLLLAAQAPTIVDANRFQAAQKATLEGADIIIMDDGFQNPSLHKDISFIVVDGNTWFGNGFCIPAGPLRESIASGLKRANAIIIVGKPERENNPKELSSLPIFYASIEPMKPQTKNKNILAFAGIGRPEKFYTSLAELGLTPIETIDFPDHHYYMEKELNDIITKAKELDADIFTTTKDMVKIPNHLQKHFNALEIGIKWSDEESLTKFIMERIS